MSDILLNVPQIHTGSSLAKAAQSLAKAAATLAAAAQAMSVAANTFTSEMLAQDPQLDTSASPPAGAVPIVSYESDTELSPTEEISGNHKGATEITKQELVQRADPELEEEECTNPEDSDYYISDDDDFSVTPPLHPAGTNADNRELGSCSAGPMTLDQLRFDPARPPPIIPTGAEIVTEPIQAYRILVDNEADVLLFVCALIRNRKKAVCYMNYSLPAFNLFKKLIHDVTETPVHIITKTTPAELEAVGKKFLKENNSILLLPETVSPSLKLIDTDSWVIHVGWPADEQRYEVQRKAHEAQNNVLVAYSGDENLYPAGAGVMWQSKAWPRDVESFRVSVAVLRPLFNDKLVAIPSEMKAKLYADWIDCHGAKGRRYVRSWTPSDLVYHANLYLLDVLRYQGQDSGSTMQILLPEVSAGFVAHHGLESAVEGGILRVKPKNPGLNHISSLSRDDVVPPGSTPLNDRGVAGASNSKGSGGSTASEAPRSSTPGMAPPKPDNKDTQLIAFKPALGFTYFTLTELFDAIPLICFLALSSPYQKVLIFLDDSGSLPHYQKMINKITSGNRHVIAPQVNSEDQAQANQDAALLFATTRTPTILLLPFKPPKIPPALGGISIDYSIYWGAGGFVPLVQVRKHRTRLNCLRTSIIMTTSQKEPLSHLMADMEEHPSNPGLLDLGVDSWLYSTRKTVRSVLVANTPLARQLYEAYLYLVAKPPRTVVSAEDVARRVNEYSAKVLLRGRAADGSKDFPPVATRFATPARIIASLGLQPALTAGLLTVA